MAGQREREKRRDATADHFENLAPILACHHFLAIVRDLVRTAGNGTIGDRQPFGVYTYIVVVSRLSKCRHHFPIRAEQGHVSVDERFMSKLEFSL